MTIQSHRVKLPDIDEDNTYMVVICPETTGNKKMFSVAMISNF